MQHPPFSTSRSEWRRAREQLESAGGRSTVGGWPRVRLWPWLDAALKVFGVCLRLIGLYERGCRNALDLHVMRLEFQFTDLPAALDGYRILHLTDLHLDGLAGIVPIAVERLRGLEADLCVLTGDYRKGTSGPYEQILPMLAELLSAVRAADGVYAILGNHDCAAMVEPVEALGLRMLLNESVEIEREDATLTLTGLDDVHWFYSEAALSALQCAPGRFKIALVHSAEIADRAAESGYALYLAGHSHAGQICLPGGRPLLTHMVRLRRYASGAWRCADLQGYTSSGVGTSGLPVRFNTRSEVALITLRRREPLRSRREDPSP